MIVGILWLVDHREQLWIIVKRAVIDHLLKKYSQYD